MCVRGIRGEFGTLLTPRAPCWRARVSWTLRRRAPPPRARHAMSVGVRSHPHSGGGCLLSLTWAACLPERRCTAGLAAAAAAAASLEGAAPRARCDHCARPLQPAGVDAPEAAGDRGSPARRARALRAGQPEPHEPQAAQGGAPRGARASNPNPSPNPSPDPRPRSRPTPSPNPSPDPNPEPTRSERIAT